MLSVLNVVIVGGRKAPQYMLAAQNAMLSLGEKLFRVVMFMSEVEKPDKFELAGFVSIEGRSLVVAVLDSAGKSVEKRCFAYLGDVSELILGMRKADVRLYKWLDKAVK